uniref:Uncharacterized protein n=1 Tax=mine drainage metagenome TaxID=410659 RepID=E6QIM4_9ZZZZ
MTYAVFRMQAFGTVMGITGIGESTPVPSNENDSFGQFEVTFREVTHRLARGGTSAAGSV